MKALKFLMIKIIKNEQFKLEYNKLKTITKISVKENKKIYNS